MDRPRVPRGRVAVGVFRRYGDSDDTAGDGTGRSARPRKYAAAAADTLTAALVPVSDPLTVSVAVTVLLPAVLSVTLKLPEPFVNVELAGRTAAGSLLVKWTVPHSQLLYCYSYPWPPR